MAEPDYESCGVCIVATSFTPTSLVAGSYIPASTQVLYTVPLNTSVQIEAMTVNNTDTVAHQVTIYLAPNSATAAGQYQVMTRILAAGESVQVYQAVNQVMKASGTIQASCDTPGVVALHASGLAIV
jgi:hypothetical protein